MLRVSSSITSITTTQTAGARGLLVAVGTAALLACGKSEQGTRANSRGDATEQGRVVVPMTDSGAVVSSAIAALQNTAKPMPLRVSRFIRQPDGTLVTVIPADQRTLGGGGVIWVPREGPAIVLSHYE